MCFAYHLAYPPLEITSIPGYAGDYCLSHKIAAAAGSQEAKMCYSSSSSVTAGEGFFFFFLAGA